MLGVLAPVTLSSAAGVAGGMHTLRDDGAVGAGTLREGDTGSGTLRDGVVAAGGCAVCGLVVPWRMVMSCCSAVP